MFARLQNMLAIYVVCAWTRDLSAVTVWNNQKLSQFDSQHKEV